MRNAHRTIVGTVAAAVVLALVPMSSAPAEAGNRRCEDTRRGTVCANMHTPGKSSKLRKESRRLKTWKHLPMDAETSVSYKGYARRNLTNGRDVFAVRSKINRKLWHTYTIRQVAECVPAKWDAEAAGRSASIVYPEYAPTCQGHLWTLRASNLPEDAYGWNCWIDGNRDCGEMGSRSADDCVTFSSDGYTMCADGRVYVKDGLQHLAELVRR